MREMDRNSAIQVLVGLVMSYAQEKDGDDRDAVIEVSMRAMMELGVDHLEIKHAMETAPFIQMPNPREDLTIRFPNEGV